MTPGPDAVTWDDPTIARLRSLWAEGHSAARIGEAMGVSKNAIVGKAHRLGLAGRPSPIRRDGAPAPPMPVRAPLVTLPPPVAAPPTPAPAPRVGPARTCCWPMGEPGTKAFRFCGAEADGFRPYCAEHAAVAYVRVRDRREGVA